MTSGKWDMKNWTKGKVTLAQAFGLSAAHQAQIQYPKLAATLPGAVSAAQAAGNKAQQSATSSAPPNVKGDYTQAELAALWISAGGNPANAHIASAIAMAESGGNPGAIDNDSNGTQDRGLWQINSSNGALSVFNPTANARSAITMSNNGTNWNPWVTYTTGEYLKYM